MSRDRGRGSTPRESTGPLPDIFAPRLDVLFVGINPGLRSAAHGHHYAGHGNRFWKLLFEAGLVPEPLGFHDDRRMVEFGYGLTNIVERASRGVGDLGPEEFARGRAALARKIARLEPRIVAFVGVTVYRAFFAERGPVRLGEAVRSSDSRGPRGQGHPGGGARPRGREREPPRWFVLPNPSGRNAHCDRAEMLAAFRALADAVTALRTDRGRTGAQCPSAGGGRK